MQRRQVLRLGALAALATACRRAWKDSGPGADSGQDTGPALGCDPPTPGSAAEGWVELALADYPALAEVGGAAQVDVDEALLHVIVAQPSAGCFVAVWSVCSHGACTLAWGGDALVCPCHGSEFSTEGEVIQGPATEPVRAFPVARAGESLFIYRPR